MAYTTIDNPGSFFKTVLYTGNGSTQSVTGAGFQPDWVWIKERDDTSNHNLYDSVRGVQKYIYSNESTEQLTGSNSLTAFDSDGFSVGNGSFINQSSQGYASWNWKAGGTASSNSDGSITSSVSANTTSGFSIVSYTGTGSNATIGHGLGAIPKMYIARNITDSEQWTTYHVGLDATAPQNYHIRLNTTDARVDEAAVWNDTAPTSSVFSVGDSGAPNGNGDSHIAYCFAEKKGYSKFGSYTGNGNDDGPFVYTGFRPAFIIIKPSSKSEEWTLIDNKRLGFNVDNNYVYPNQNYAEGTSNRLDITANGFKLRDDTGETNTSGATMIYMAFAEAPFVTAGTKAAGTAR